MLIDGLRIISESPIYTDSIYTLIPLFVMAGIILFGIVFMLIEFCKANYDKIYTCAYIILATMIIEIIYTVVVLMIEYSYPDKDGSIFFRETNNKTYQCEIVDKVDLKELYENYEIVSYENNILTIKDKK